ncbi:hypothetical protein LTR49_024962 [Elasticomyces elasticus]|nr:hypothetical protein LTR49_024962 [Elasticomyces elasticus]KAK5737875.1 hypothetical protein LTS12_025750 [Elasticomyces elasticus]
MSVVQSGQARGDSTPSRPLTDNTSVSPGPNYRYPDPGYLGSSSHVAIFNRVSEQRGMDARGVDSFETQQDGVPYTLDDTKLSKGTHLIASIVSQLDTEAFKGLVSFWLGKGTNLALGGPFTTTCVSSVTDVLASLADDPASHNSLARRLFQNSARRHTFLGTATFADFCEELCQENIKWETVVISLVALGRATIDVPYYPRLYSLQAELESLRKLITKLADSCLELALSLGGMHDLLLVCQYENWILHSVIDGDQSLESWRRLGDVISSVLYLGYHQLSKPKPNTPHFLTEMRKASFARIYSDDKNVAVFLGRPPRLSRTFCCFQLPQRPFSCEGNAENCDDQEAFGSSDQLSAFFGSHEAITFSTSIRWAALCARLKEKALEVIHAADPEETKRQEAAAVNIELTQLWSELPQHLKLEGSLQTHRHRRSFEQDFLLFARLEYLQVTFLLGSSELLQHNAGAPPEYETLLAVAGEMLSLVVEAIVLRDHLVNSGTGLVWKVAHYGLPAAGIISLSLLQPLPSTYRGAIPIHKMVQNLGVFVAEVQGEGFVRTSDPDYALLHRAAHTIDRLLATLLCGTLRKTAIGDLTSAAAHVPASNNIDELPQWNLPASGDSLGYEFDFWRMLGEHPSLLPPSDIAMEPEWLSSAHMNSVYM